MGRLHQRHQRRPGRRPRPGCCCCCCTTATLAACVAASPRCGCGWRYCVRLRSGTTRARWIALPPRTWCGASPLHKHAQTHNRAQASAQRCARQTQPQPQQTAATTTATQSHSHHAPDASAVRRGPLMSLGFSQPASWHSWSVVGTGDGVGLMTAPSLCCGGDGTVVRPSKPTHTHTQQHQHARQARPA